MPAIQIPKEFFRRERCDIYTNWRRAFWRELFQNSTDAGARAIRVEFSALPDGATRVVFDDDGCGKTRDVLENVYFRLGTTTKTDASTIGGFGRARILTCFSMERYRILTLGSIVRGDGAYYDIADLHPIRPGCRLEIDIGRDDADACEMRSALESYLGLSHIRSDVTIDGKPFQDWLPAGRKLRDLTDRSGRSIAAVHANRAAAERNQDDAGKIIVRVRGAYMFQRHVSTLRTRVVVELDPAQSRSLLTASRDDMTGDARRTLDDFLTELATERTTSLKEKRRRRTTIFRSSGFLVTSASKPAPAQSQETGGPPEIAAFVGERTRPGLAVVRHSAVENVSFADQAAHLPELPDVVIVSEDPDPEIAAASRRYDPATWDSRSIARARRGNGYSKYRLLIAWKRACEASIEAIMRAYETDDIHWTIGWYFGEPDTLAVCKSSGQGHVLCLNPVDRRGRLKWHLGKRAHLNRLLAYARHEAAHIFSDYHDERFAQILTRIDGETDDARIIASMRR